MDSLLNSRRPPVFCPGCAHERVVHILDKTLIGLGLQGDDVVIVTDIGCSGLFDTFFDTHAFHGLHGRALTYATGIKMAQPNLNVIVTMGDGGLGIGGAHVLSTCRRNIDLTLLVLNNFNYGMTGGQCSATTPRDARVGSGFLNQLEQPLDICQVAAAAGAPMVARVSTYQKDLGAQLAAAIEYKGFALVDIWGICPGRYTRQNKLTPKQIAAELSRLPAVDPSPTADETVEYGWAYRRTAAQLPPAPQPVDIATTCSAPETGRRAVVLLGSAGQRIVTAGELLCLAAATAGNHATQKNDYPITVMRGHSVSEVILSDTRVGYTGIDLPAVVLALADEGVARRRKLFATLTPDVLIIKAAGVDLPPCAARIIEVDFKARKIKPQDWALAALAVLAGQNRVITPKMLDTAIGLRFKKKVHDLAVTVVDAMRQEDAVDASAV